MSKIIRVEIGRYDYNFSGEFKFFKPGPDGKIRRPSVLVRLTDAEGRQGWGQAVPVPTWSDETPATVESSLRTYLAPAVLGADPADPADVHRRMNAVIRPHFSVGQPLAKAAIDLACFDLAGKQTSQPVVELLGGPAQDAVQLSWTVASPDMAHVEQQLEEGRARGYTHFNIKVGYPQTPEYDMALTRKVRAFAPDGFLWADANTGYDPQTALDVAPRLADAGADVLESPLPPNRIRGYQALKQQGALPIYMDEGMLSPVEVEEFILLGMLDGVTLKPARSAGLWPSSQIVAVVRQHGLGLLGSGLTDPDLSLAAALHLYTSIGLQRPCALNGPQYLAESLAQQPLQPKAGWLQRPQGPGLALPLSERAEATLSVAAEG